VCVWSGVVSEQHHRLQCITQHHDRHTQHGSVPLSCLSVCLSLCVCLSVYHSLSWPSSQHRFVSCLCVHLVPSVLWHCWLGGRKGIRPVKNWVVGCWHGYLSGARCRVAHSPADATATHCLLLQWKIQTGFTFLVPAHSGSPGQRAIKRTRVRVLCVHLSVCLCVCVSVCLSPIIMTVISTRVCM